MILSSAVRADELACGPLQNAFGPLDYRTASAFERKLVEGAHFTSEVESLRAGKTSTLPGGDLDYTLRAFPNHPRALAAVSRYSMQRKQPKPPGLKWAADCYFDRAFRFQPNDPMPIMLYGIHLVRTGRKTEALEYLDKAATFQSNDANFHYNLGLGFLEVGRSEQALEHAKIAYANGFPLQGLRRRLTEAGAWKD
jgi:predicted Zn-dependent protease